MKHLSENFRDNLITLLLYCKKYVTVEVKKLICKKKNQLIEYNVLNVHYILSRFKLHV